MGKLEGRVAIVTGAGTGLGLATARRLADEGALVMMADADEAKIRNEASILVGKGGRAKAFRCEAGSKLDLNNLLAATMDEFGRVNVLVNAFWRAEDGDAATLPIETLDAALNASVRSAVLMTQLVARRMIVQQERGSEIPAAVVNLAVSGGGGAIPSRFAAGMAAAALSQLTRAFAVSLAPQGIRVNGVIAGGVTGPREAANVQATREAIIAQTPMGRLGEPSEVASAALFLASEEASYLTGQVLAADGGRQAQDIILPGVDNDS